ncbi:MAG: hypothetical protein DKM50_10015 [Candidatus Margulisiibacteriota bacterium]|nr:MAG: hypothetical protein A2X43_04100 [Candidatus Margulisbacteria bacterium GWD2_39_127]OGI05183.1 MAG: hypothetical protein A2X42_02610 [Candidatus Margulisbacteria bacterium GWF2_38_17]OGI06232.1 MAG: hypothetical protein A2X41_08190 [Candidatus Margulisbacteria bacterium GWE2_39_32]PZM78888.1 MAG: hypothetical protein DKM50_10015 [Candidatus Margulisiibacteriota bacterium]HAR64530.1 hypothetical protein [Candidatus Margulisiibacteriota bacterium]
MSNDISNKIIRLREAEDVLYTELQKIIIYEKTVLADGNYEKFDPIMEKKKNIMYKINIFEAELQTIKKRMSVSDKSVLVEVNKKEKLLAEKVAAIQSMEDANIKIIIEKLAEINKEVGTFGKKKHLEKHFGAYKSSPMSSKVFDAMI